MPAQAQASSTLTVAWDTDIDSLDPHVFKSVGGYAVQCNLYDPVVGWKVRPVEGKPGVSRSFPNEFEGGIAEILDLRDATARRSCSRSGRA